MVNLLEYASNVWSPYFTINIDYKFCIENVQGHFTKGIESISDLPRTVSSAGP